MKPEGEDSDLKKARSRRSSDDGISASGLPEAGSGKVKERSQTPKKRRWYEWIEAALQGLDDVMTLITIIGAIVIVVLLLVGATSVSFEDLRALVGR